jgi:hypothetical protein
VEVNILLARLWIETSHAAGLTLLWPCFLGLPSPSSRFGQGFPDFPGPCVRLTFPLDAGWLIVPAVLRFRKYPLLLNFPHKAFEGSFK